MLEKSLIEYFKFNTTKDTSMGTVWAAHKAFIRGEIIQMSTQIKRERTAEVESLEREYATLRSHHKKNLE